MLDCTENTHFNMKVARVNGICVVLPYSLRMSPAFCNLIPANIPDHF